MSSHASTSEQISTYVEQMMSTVPALSAGDFVHVSGDTNIGPLHLSGNLAIGPSNEVLGSSSMAIG